MSFDRLAPHYHWLEAVGFGSVLQKARTRWIETVPRPKRVLTVGEGTGHFLRKFVRVHRDAVVDCLDASARMLELARLHTSGPVNRVRFLRKISSPGRHRNPTIFSSRISFSIVFHKTNSNWLLENSLESQLPVHTGFWRTFAFQKQFLHVRTQKSG